MDSIDSAKRKRSYTLIDEHTRKMVIQSYFQDKLTILKTSQKYNLKPSSVRSILRAFKKEGRLGKKKTRRHRTQVLNTIHLHIRHPNLRINLPPLTMNLSQNHLNESTQQLDQEPGIKSLTDTLFKTNIKVFTEAVKIHLNNQEYKLFRNLIDGIDQCLNPTYENSHKSIANGIQNSHLQSIIQQRHQQLLLMRFQLFNNYLQSQIYQQQVYSQGQPQRAHENTLTQLLMEKQILTKNEAI